MAQLSQAEAAKRIAELEAALAAKNKLTYKVSEKGGISVYGLQRFPVTLYAGQWRRIAEIMPDMLKYMEENKSRLAEKL